MKVYCNSDTRLVWERSLFIRPVNSLILLENTLFFSYYSIKSSRWTKTQIECVMTELWMTQRRISVSCSCIFNRTVGSVLRGTSCQPQKHIVSAHTSWSARKRILTQTPLKPHILLDPSSHSHFIFCVEAMSVTPFTHSGNNLHFLSLCVFIGSSSLCSTSLIFSVHMALDGCIRWA